MTRPTAKWMAEHRAYAVKIIDTYRTMPGFKYLKLHNDIDDYDLGTFTPEGTLILEMLIAQHRCGKACIPDCAILHLIWLIEGCPDAGEPAAEAIKRNSVKVIGAES